MKKFNLLLLAACCGMSAMAADFEWNSEWIAPSQASTNAAYGYWYGNAAVPDPMPEHKEATIYCVPESIDPDDVTADFDVLWNAIADGPMEISSLVDGDATNSEINWKATYDAENIYILIKAEKETSAESDVVEVCVSPYFTVTGVPDPKDAYVRYLQFGAWKAEMSAGGAGGTPKICSGNIATQQPEDGAFVVAPSWSVEMSGNDAKWIVTIPYLAISGDNYVGFCEDDGTLQSVAAWNALCDGKGLNFDIKYKDNGTAYWWNTKHNDAYQSTAYCGFLNAGNNVAIDEAQSDILSNMTITASQIKLAVPADVKIMNAAGMLIKSVNDASEVSISDLSAGTYIVVAGNETATFIK